MCFVRALTPTTALLPPPSSSAVCLLSVCSSDPGDTLGGPAPLDLAAIIQNSSRAQPSPSTAAPSPVRPPQQQRMAGKRASDSYMPTAARAAAAAAAAACSPQKAAARAAGAERPVTPPGMSSTRMPHSLWIQQLLSAPQSASAPPAARPSLLARRSASGTGGPCESSVRAAVRDLLPTLDIQHANTHEHAPEAIPQRQALVAAGSRVLPPKAEASAQAMQEAREQPSHWSFCKAEGSGGDMTVLHSRDPVGDGGGFMEEGHGSGAPQGDGLQASTEAGKPAGEAQLNSNSPTSPEKAAAAAAAAVAAVGLHGDAATAGRTSAPANSGAASTASHEPPATPPRSARTAAAAAAGLMPPPSPRMPHAPKMCLSLPLGLLDMASTPRGMRAAPVSSRGQQQSGAITARARGAETGGQGNEQQAAGSLTARGRMELTTRGGREQPAAQAQHSSSGSGTARDRSKGHGRGGAASAWPATARHQDRDEGKGGAMTARGAGSSKKRNNRARKQKVAGATQESDVLGRRKVDQAASRR